jgi:hypothetical protein
MKLTQKALLFHKAEFEFGDKMLTYRIEDEKARAGMTILYENIGIDKSLQSYREKSPVYLGLIIIGAAIASLIGHPAHGSRAPDILTGVLTALGWASLIAGRFAKFDSTVIATPLGKIIVFDREGRQQIIDEIFRRRSAELRRKYLAVDFLNEPKNEIGKYRWLKTEGVISEDEFNLAIEKISAAGGKAGAS